MEINVSTCYGDVILHSAYDCSVGESFYDAYDELGNHLGELWNMPYYDEDDEEIDDVFTAAVETAINNEDIAIPYISDEKPNEAYVATVCEKNGTCVMAYSELFDSMEKAREYKANIIYLFVEKLTELGIRYDVNDADVICECRDEGNEYGMYLCVTLKLAEIK
jgi:hypothetical protein